ncbi:YbaY family lipoprotein [Chitinilyticum piscinae]|uniref:YbaY family lipoprotein n=1 Tax=Chitinilyticum piscinae TaxID=2866724 RepID=A0A8J7FLY7_9NEIS|nr:YbaY family lipoprotein [Chitinilyticum piscinae]MBE9608791.1 YbaY family lipoprotein [Chitinilyticum piscinae]
MKTLAMTLFLGLMAAQPALASERDYECRDSISRSVRQVSDNAIWLQEGELQMLMQRTRSASGVRYASGNTVWWEKGASVMFEQAGKPVVACTPSLEQAVSDRAVTAHISWLQRRLFPGATLEVALLDVSLADAPARVISKQSIRLEQGAPLSVSLPYSAGQIDERFSYAVQVRMLQDEKLIMINTTRSSVLTHGAGQEVNVLLQPVR